MMYQPILLTKRNLLYNRLMLSIGSRELNQAVNMVFNFYYIDVVSTEPLADFEQRLEMITLDMLRSKIADSTCQLIVTTNKSLFGSHSIEKLISLNNKLFLFNAMYALDVCIFSPLTELTMHAALVMPMLIQDITGLGTLYLIFHYVQTYVSLYQHHGVNFHYYGSEQQVNMLSEIFCDHGALTCVLIPQCITLSLHAWFDPVKGFFNKHVIKGSCDVQLEYKPMLSLFSTVLKQLPNNLFVHSNKPQLNPPTADIEPARKRLKSSKPVVSKPIEIVFPIGLSEMSKLQQLGKQRKFTYHPDELEAQRLDMFKIDVIAVLGSSSKNLGVFANTAIAKNQVLGIYMGKKVSLRNRTQNTDYLFELNDSDGINALKIRN